MPNDRTDVATLAARLDAVERALTDGERADSKAVASTEPAPGALGASSDGGAADDGTAETIRRLERRVAELTAELDAVRGLLGGVEAVNESVERRADLALATAERAATERAAADRESDGLVVERLPDGNDVDGDPSSAVDAAETGAEAADETDAGSLAARLRGAL
ncbi:hypothetical protein NDI76_04360 [Halogeometricum sp. S1BR25-6]|uniref:DUF7310 domain-containing protein n=1 Tax=Halogeometricum salsisoli TaxID=2950536 RepID=A0ABU2GBY5_9EURY|nr:hypothetical protein [Halogeometricum sp. S1BR25-6]MDS0297966.1 hypothetical protein [Halogeometricum sp. S1BR25-6]